MKYKLIEKTPPPKTRKKEAIILQQIEDILVLNYYQDKKLKMRHCVNVDSGEYATYSQGLGSHFYWSTTNLGNSMGFLYPHRTPSKYKALFTEEMESEVHSVLIAPKWTIPMNAYWAIYDKESDYNYKKAYTAEQRRREKVKRIMDLIEEAPDEFREWAGKKVSKGMEYIVRDTLTEEWMCSKCGKSSAESDFLIKPKRAKMNTCPVCGKAVKVVNNKKNCYIDINGRASLVQPIDENLVVMRHFDVRVHYSCDKTKEIWLSEATRVVMPKDGRRTKFNGCDIYYNSISKTVHPYSYHYAGYSFSEHTCFDNKSNPANRRMGEEYLYPKGLEYFEGTKFEKWLRSFLIASKLEIKTDYNSMMAVNSKKLPEVAEMLIKGRFYNLFKELSHYCWNWSGEYFGPLNLEGSTINEVFDIEDTQLINRLRERNGTVTTYKWLKYSEESGVKINDKTLSWLEKELLPSKADILEYMSPEQFMNYIKRQNRESYPAFTVGAVIEQYADYIDMAKATGKNVEDPMVYKPRELKHRHDQLVTEKEKLQIVKAMNANREEREKQAQEMRERFPEAEGILKEIKPKLEWEDEEYLIKVPEDLIEIVIEGAALHHCAGATDRYFDRIMEKETFICFLRRKEEPGIPYYTIEVEPGGTIRQHRGAYDEEPNIEEVKKHLKKWQQAIRKRITKEDKHLEKLSKIKRENNIKELEAAGNVRVLNGLAEDFMEAI